jgi:NAD(P)H-flavin reductase
MSTITFKTHQITCHPDETLLDAILRNNIDVPHNCKSGSCHTCLMRSPDQTPPAHAQEGLKPTQKQQNYFLACLCKPDQDMTITLPDKADNFITHGKVISKQQLSKDIIELKLECNIPFRFKAGQFVNLMKPDEVFRSYSIANTPNKKNIIEFHIRILPGGQFSEWISNELAVGDQIPITDAKGNCFYIPERQEQGLLLIGTGSGLAPLAGILMDALEQKHTGPIHLLHGSKNKEGLYRIDEMKNLAEQQQNFHYTACISGAGAGNTTPETYARGRANEVALKKITDLKGWRVYLCGHPEMVEQTKKLAFLQGAAMQDIYADAFIHTPRP